MDLTELLNAKNSGLGGTSLELYEHLNSLNRNVLMHAQEGEQTRYLVLVMLCRKTLLTSIIPYIIGFYVPKTQVARVQKSKQNSLQN